MCRHESFRHEGQYFFSFEIDPDDPLAGTNFVEKMEADVSVELRCKDPCTSSRHTRTERIRNPPRFFVLQLKRFASSDGVTRKLNTVVRHKRDIRISEKDFTLCGLVLHLGEETNAGHYVAFVLRFGKWWLCDDAKSLLVGSPSDIRRSLERRSGIQMTHDGHTRSGATTKTKLSENPTKNEKKILLLHGCSLALLMLPDSPDNMLHVVAREKQTTPKRFEKMFFFSFSPSVLGQRVGPSSTSFAVFFSAAKHTPGFFFFPHKNEQESKNATMFARQCLRKSHDSQRRGPLVAFCVEIHV